MEKSNVLFVNIGWAPSYDGMHVIEGGHTYISDHRGTPDEISEGSAFKPNASGNVTCGVGNGRLPVENSVDVFSSPEILKIRIMES